MVDVGGGFVGVSLVGVGVLVMAAVIPGSWVKTGNAVRWSFSSLQAVRITHTMTKIASVVFMRLVSRMDY